MITPVKPMSAGRICCWSNHWLQLKTNLPSNWKMQNICVCSFLKNWHSSKIIWAKMQILPSMQALCTFTCMSKERTAKAVPRWCGSVFRCLITAIHSPVKPVFRMAARMTLPGCSSTMSPPEDSPTWASPKTELRSAVKTMTGWILTLIWFPL